MTSTKNPSKLVRYIPSRQMYSPFRSSKVKRSLNYTSNPPLLHKLSKFSPLRSRISPRRAFLSDLQPLRSLITPDSSTSDSIQSRYNSNNLAEETLNFIQTPSTIKEEEPLYEDFIDESLNHYFNFEVHPHISAGTPMPHMITPDVRGYHRYQKTMPMEFIPHRSETPEIPTRRLEHKMEVKLPAVEKKVVKTGRDVRKNRSPSPQEIMSRNASTNKNNLEYFHRTKKFQIFRKNKV